MKKLAVNQLGNALASGGSVFASDDDPELIQAAVPFSLKLMESLLAENPRHAGLLLATARGFTQFSYAFVEQEADRREADNLSASEHLRARARRLYLRAKNYGVRGLELAHPGFESALRADPKQAVLQTHRRDVPLLYWTSAAWGAAIGVSKNDPSLVGEQVLVEAMIDRALALDEAYERGAIHSFLITYEMARQGGPGDPSDRARRHFERALILSDNQAPGPYVAYAESVLIKKQDVNQFRDLLQKALAIDPDAVVESRLETRVIQDRARWLLSRVDELFLVPNNESAP